MGLDGNHAPFQIQILEKPTPHTELWSGWFYIYQFYFWMNNLRYLHSELPNRNPSKKLF